MLDIKAWINKITQTTLVGEIKAFAGASVPAGWLACDGSAVSRTTYAALFAAIGTTWGTGDGSTTFNLPDLRGRALIGAGTGSGLTARTLGGKVGAETHKLENSQMPAHTHTFSVSGGSPGGWGAGGSNTSRFRVDANSPAYGWSWALNNTGGGQAHNNMQPSAVVRFIIYGGGYCLNVVFSMLSAIERWWEHVRSEEAADKGAGTDQGESVLDYNLAEQCGADHVCEHVGENRDINVFRALLRRQGGNDSVRVHVPVPEGYVSNGQPLCGGAPSVGWNLPGIYERIKQDGVFHGVLLQGDRLIPERGWAGC